MKTRSLRKKGQLNSGLQKAILLVITILVLLGLLLYFTGVLEGLTDNITGIFSGFGSR